MTDNGLLKNNSKNILTDFSLHISKMNDSNNAKDRRVELGICYYFKLVLLFRSVIVLSESGLGLLLNVHCKL